MTAVLSISRAEAIALTGERSARWIQRENESCDGDAWPHLVRWVAENEVLVFLDDISEEEVDERLSHEVAVHDAVLLLGMIFDTDIPLETRAEIAADIERSIEDRHDLDCLAARLYSEPFPTGVNFEDAERAALDASAVNLRALLKALQASQPAITTTVLAWEAIPNSAFADLHQKSRVRADYRDHGLFQTFARSAPEQPNEFLIEWLPSVRSPADANHRRILMEWTRPFRRQLHSEFSEEDWRRAAQEAVETDDEQIIEADTEIPTVSMRLFKRYPGLLQEIESRKAGIRALIQSGDLNEAETAAISLGDFQCEYGEPRFAAMSLCDLARFAEEKGLIEVGLKFIAQALALCPGVPWSQVQHASLLRAGGRTAEAFVEYGTLVRANLASKYDVVARCGYAECLRELGRPIEALNSYQQTLASHSENVVARNGYAECLRELGKTEEALNWHRETLASHPNYVVARNGYAECLRELGRPTEALNWYQETLASHSDNVVARNGYAECLRELGRPTEALNWYQDTMASHSTNIFARCGYAECLRELGRPTEALNWYQETLASHSNNVVARCGYAECLRELGRLAEALNWYQETLASHSNYVVARCGYAECLRDLGRPAEALNWYQETMASHPNNVVARCGYAECLRDLGRPTEALNWYRETMASHPNDVVARCATASLLIQLRRYAEALRMLPTAEPVTLQDWIAIHVRGMAYLRAGDLDAAQRLFERGVGALLPIRQSAYFRSALALCHLRRRDPRKAAETLANVHDAKLETAMNIIRVHAFGADGRIPECRDLLAEIGEPRKSLARELTAECKHRFIEQAPRKDEDWLFEGEFEMLLAA